MPNPSAAPGGSADLRAPHSPEGERFVLGAVLLDGRRFADVAASLGEDDFLVPAHRCIFAAMRAVHARGGRIEYVAVIDELRTLGKLEATGHVVGGLTAGMPRTGFLDGYVSIVKEKALRRRLMSVGASIAASAAHGDLGLAETLSEAVASVQEIGTADAGGGPRSAGDLLEALDGGPEALLDPARSGGGVASPWPDLEDLTGGFRPGQLVVLAGRPAMGKTAAALNIAATAARAGASGTVALFSLEMSAEENLSRIVFAEARVDHRELRRGRLGPGRRRDLRAALGRVSRMALHIDDSPGLGIAELGARCRRLQSGPGLGLVIVDYLQLMASKGRVESRVQEISAFSRGLKLLARDLRVPVVALSQLSRGPEGKGRKDARPRLSDLRDSGAIEQDADVVLFVYRGEVYEPSAESLRGRAELIVAKQRNGPTGTVHLAWLERIASFASLDRGVRPEPEEIPADEPADLWGGVEGGSVRLSEH